MKRAMYFNFSLSVIFFLLLILVFLLPKREETLARVGAFADLGTVVIDAGHGGEDGGAVGKYNIIEKDINLSVACKLELILNLYGINTEMIRQSDVSLGDASASTLKKRKVNDIKKRVEFVVNTPRALLVSIHQNSFPQDSSCKGAQVFYSKNNIYSETLAESVRIQLKNGNDSSNKREIKPADKNIYLLNNVNCPAILVECGFLSNPEEAKTLCKDTYRTKIATCIASGIINCER